LTPAWIEQIKRVVQLSAGSKTNILVLIGYLLWGMF
jgi:hypothetical protein